MLVCDSNVRGIRERNKLGLIIMSADVNPYKNKSSLLFFSPPRQIRRPELAAVVLIDALPPLVCSTHHLCDVDMQSVVHPSRCHHWSHRGTFDPRQTSLTARCHTQKKKAEPTVKFTFTAFYRTSYSHVRATPPWKQQIPQMNAAFGTSFFSLTIF